MLCSVGLMFSMFSRCTKDKSPPIVCYWRVLCGRGLQTLFSFLSLSLFFFFVLFLLKGGGGGHVVCWTGGRGLLSGVEGWRWRYVYMRAYACIPTWCMYMYVHVDYTCIHSKEGSWIVLGLRVGYSVCCFKFCCDNRLEFIGLSLQRSSALMCTCE